MTYPQESPQVTGGYYMNNLVSIAKYLMANGYSRAAAAGIAGTIAGESSGNPESVGSGGAGLIGWTPPGSGAPYRPIVTGNRQADWQHQLADLLNYANNNSPEAVARGGVNLSTLKKASDPQQAARWWSQFEGPLNPGSDIRSEAVNKVYTALGGTTETPGPPATAQADTGSAGGTSVPAGTDSSNPLSWTGNYIKGMEWAGKWISGVTVGPITSEAQGLSGITGGIAGVAQSLSKIGQLLALLMRPSFWLRIGAFFAGLLAAGAGVYFLKGALT